LVDLKRLTLRGLIVAIADGLPKAVGELVYAAADLHIGLAAGSTSSA